MYEQIYNLTCMFFKSLKGNLMYEFNIRKTCRSCKGDDICGCRISIALQLI